MDKNTLIERYPRLYQMAEVGGYPSIFEHGLLSTVAALDRYEVRGVERFQLESAHRPEKVTLASKAYEKVVLRDQKPRKLEEIREEIRVRPQLNLFLGHFYDYFSF